MARLVLFIALVILSLHNSIAQPVSYPELKLVRHSLSGNPFFNRFVVMTFDLELTDGQKKVYDEKSQEVRDFVKKFEEEKEKLEREYNGSSGEARIQKARALLNFVLRSEQAWQEFTVGMGTEWKGVSTLKMDLAGIKVFAKGDIYIKLGGFQPGALLTHAKTLAGNAEGTFEVKADIPSAIFIDGFYTSKGELIGSSQMGKIWLTKSKSDYRSVDGQMVLAIPGMVGYGITNNGEHTFQTYSWFGYSYGKGNQTHSSGYMVIRDFLTGMYVRRDFNITHTPIDDDSYMWLEYSDPLIENINFQELKDKYFRFYINDIVKFRLQEYNAGDLEGKARLAERTLKELASAHSYGQLIGVSDFVFQELTLVYQSKGSLYDDWFGLWFRPSDEIWQRKINVGGSESVQLKNLEGRVKNAIEAISNGQMIASDELMQELQLFPKSDFMSGIIADYFAKGNEVHCANRLANNITDEQFRQWKLQVYRSAVVYASGEVASMVANSNCPSQ